MVGGQRNPADNHSSPRCARIAAVVAAFTCACWLVDQASSRVIWVRGPRACRRRGRVKKFSRRGRPIAHDCLVLLVPDADFQRMSSELSADQQRDPARMGAWLSDAWSEAYRSQVPDSILLEFEEVATFLFDQAGSGRAAGGPYHRGTRVLPAWPQGARCCLPAGLPIASREGCQAA